MATGANWADQYLMWVSTPSWPMEAASADPTHTQTDQIIKKNI